MVLKGSLLVVIVGLSTHVDPHQEAGFALFLHLSQTRLLVDSHPELQGHLSFPRETHPQWQQETGIWVLFLLNPL